MRIYLLSSVLLLAAAASGKDGGAKPVVYLPSDDVSAAFAQGRPLLETDGYKIHASRREGPGMAEIHERDTDIVYVLEGSATLVTGGEAVDAKTAAPEEFRGTSIRDGETRELAPGDVVVIPNGVPHWFRRVDSPFLYYVVKVRASEGGSR